MGVGELPLKAAVGDREAEAAAEVQQPDAKGARVAQGGLSSDGLGVQAYCERAEAEVEEPQETRGERVQLERVEVRCEREVRCALVDETEEQEGVKEASVPQERAWSVAEPVVEGASSSQSWPPHRLYSVPPVVRLAQTS